MMIRMSMPTFYYSVSAIAQRCREITKKLLRPYEKATVSHLEEADENYLQHLWFTIKMASRFFYVGVVLIVHGLLPFIFTRTASNETAKINAIMQSRRTLVNDRQNSKDGRKENYDI